MVYSTAEQRHRSRQGARDLFGHPRGLTFLFATEMWERFSYYGMRALLVLYMVKYLLLPGHADNVIGLRRCEAVFECMFGPLGVQPFSSHIYGLYTGLVYLTPVFGGMLADRVLGQHRTIVLGAALMAIGHFMMAFEPLFLFALDHAHSRQRRVQAQHVGAGRRTLCARRPAPRPRLFDLLRRHQCRRVSRAAGLRNARRTAGLALRLHRRRHRHDDRARDLSLRLAAHCRRTNCTGPWPRASRTSRSTASEWRAILALIALFVPMTLFWATYEQQGNTIALWADDHTDRSINLLFWHGEIPITWFQAFNPLHDLRLHAVRHRALGVAGVARHASPRPSPRWRSAASAWRSPI